MYTNSKSWAAKGTLLQRGDAASPEVFTTIAEIKTVQRSGSKADTVDVTNMDSVGRYREWLQTLVDGGEIAFTGNYIPHDSTQQTLQSDFDNGTRHNWKIVLPAASIQTAGFTTPGHWAFTAFVSGLDFDLAVDKEATISGKLKITGAPVFTDESA